MSHSIARMLSGIVVASLVSACGGGSAAQQADAAEIDVPVQRDGATTFIRLIDFKGTGLEKLASVNFVVAPMANATARPVDVSYSAAALARRGYMSQGSVTLPVFGLYAGLTNTVDIEFKFDDGSKRHWTVDVNTPPYADANYSTPLIRKASPAGGVLGFSYMALKSSWGPPLIVDTDGKVRWVGTQITNGSSTAFHQNAFVTGGQKSTSMFIQELDGSTRTVNVASSLYTSFHHNIDPGKTGLLAEFNAEIGGVATLESIVAEIDATGAVQKEWNFATLIGDYMRSQGDDPSLFVRPGVDWLHTNAVTYDKRDDGLIVSSRENFVMKVDYATGRPLWILGDPTKYWYTFPSLRAKALKLADGGLYPIGQHAVSITSDGLLMLFNDGLGSQNQPSGAPRGETRTYSTVSAYSIDIQTMTAREVWDFDYGKSVFSDICSSAYEAPAQSLLVTYSVAESRSKMRLVGLNAERQVMFDFEYPTVSCNTSWNSIPVGLDKLQFD